MYPTDFGDGMKKPTVIDLFCGAGGLSLGFEKAGFEVAFANDNNKYACETYRHNIKKGDKALFEGNIEKIIEFPKADVVAGGYPCQGFSLAGKRLVADPRNKLYLEFARCVREVEPKFFVAENVKGLLTLGNGEIIKAMMREFTTINGGFSVKYKLLNAKWFGAPQDRERVVIVGVRKDLKFDFQYPEPTHGPLAVKPYVTLKDVLWDLKEKPGLYQTGTFSPIYMSRNRKRNWDEQSFTIQAGARHAPLHPDSSDMVMVGKDKWKFLHSDKVRRLSVRECARIQGFPDSFEFYGPIAEQYKQIGNAVPVPLSFAIAKQINAYFKTEPIVLKALQRV